MFTIGKGWEGGERESGLVSIDSEGRTSLASFF